MYNLIVGVLFLITFTVFLYILGYSISKKTDNKSFNLIIGYITYSFLIAIGGIPIQLLKLNYKYFLIYFVIVFLSLITFIIFRNKRNGIKVYKFNLWSFIKENWLILIIIMLIMITSVAYIEFYWMANCLDDGYYLVKAATLSKVENAFNLVPATGLQKEGFDPYIINTWELEASTYIKLLRLDPSFFLRYIMSVFNYFLLINTIIAFAKEFTKAINIKISKYFFQFISVIVLLFATQYNFLSNNNIYSIQDSWQFNTAMYYGSSIVRTMGILLILLPLLNMKKLNYKVIINCAMTSLVLLSKSTIALPVIFICYGMYFLSDFIFAKSKRIKIIGLIILLSLVLLSIPIKNISVIDKTVFASFIKNIKSPLIIICLVVIGISSLTKNKVILKINLTLLLIGLFMIANPINDITENLSIYKFVENRFFACYIYTIIIISFIYIMVFLYNKLKHKYLVYIFCILLMIGLFSLNIESFKQKYGKISKSYDIIDKNHQLIPSFIQELGSNIQGIHDSKHKKINVLVQEGIEINGYNAAVAVVLRTYAPDARVITSTGRYGTPSRGVFSKYTQEDTNSFHNFIFSPTKENYYKFKEVQEKYPINCIVTMSQTSEKYLKQLGYKLYSSFDDGINCYFIYYNDRVKTN